MFSYSFSVNIEQYCPPFVTRLLLVSMVCMEKMAEILGHSNDIGHWNASINMNGLEEQNNQEFWEIDTPKLFAGGADGIGFTNFANTAYKQFPRELLDIMAREWLDNPMNGLAGLIQLPMFQ